MRDVGQTSKLLKPFDARAMRCYPISMRINHLENNDEECFPTCRDRGGSESTLRLSAELLAEVLAFNSF